MKSKISFKNILKSIKNKKISILILAILLVEWPIYVYGYYENDIENEESIETVSTPIENEDDIDFKSKVVVAYDRTSNKVIYNKNASIITAMASTTKIMTSIIVIENTKMDEVVTVSRKAAGTGGSRLGLKYNDKVKVQDLLYGLMLRSGNDSAIALAEYVGGSVEGFVKMMNDKALMMGLFNTHFTSPHGLDNNNHYTTGKELAMMADYALENENFRKIVGTKNINIVINGETKNINNTNELLGNYEGVYGVKTGFTNNAGRCLVSAIKSNGLDFITVVIGANTKKERTIDSVKLINYIKKNYISYNIKDEITSKLKDFECQVKEINFIKANKYDVENIKVGLSSELVNSLMIKSNEEKPKIIINAINSIEAPVKKYQPIGKIQIYCNDMLVDESNIIIIDNIKRKNINDYFFEFLQNLY